MLNARPSAASPSNRSSARPVNLMRETAMAFMEADVDNSQALSLEEFMSLVPKSMKMKPAQVKMMFRQADVDGNGEISLDEYFSFVLSNASEQVAEGLSSIFNRYDTSHDGNLSLDEFAGAIKSMGFPYELGQQVFLELDVDGSGSLSYKELTEHIKNRIDRLSSDSKKLVTSLALGPDDDNKKRASRLTSGVKPGQQGLRLDPTGWTLTGVDATALRTELLSQMQLQGCGPRDLWAFMVAPRVNQGESGGEIGLEDFIEGLRKLGHMSDDDVLASIFHVVNADGSGVIGIAELFQWMSLTRAGSTDGQGSGVHIGGKEVTLQQRRMPSEIPLDELLWQPDTLRRELQYALLRNSLTPLDLVRAWDKDDDRSFSKREFLSMFKSIVNDIDLWDGALRLTVQETFAIVAGADHHIDLNEFQEWLSKGWQLRKDESGAQPAPTASSSLALKSSVNARGASRSSGTAVKTMSSTSPPEVPQPPPSEFRTCAVEAASTTGRTTTAPSSTNVDKGSRPARVPTSKEGGQGTEGPGRPVKRAAASDQIPGRRKLSQQELERKLRDSQVRLAKALMDASKVLGFDALTASQQAEINAINSVEELPGAGKDAGQLAAGRGRHTGYTTSLPSHCHKPGTEAFSTAAWSRALTSMDDVTPTRVASVSANLIEASRQIRYPSVHDPWDGRNGPPPRRLVRAGSAPSAKHRQLHQASRSVLSPAATIGQGSTRGLPHRLDVYSRRADRPFRSSTQHGRMQAESPWRQSAGEPKSTQLPAASVHMTS